MPQPLGRLRSSTTSNEQKGAATQIAELKTLVVGYAKQETVDPLKTLGRYVGFGLAGSILIGAGLSMLLLALLRGLQAVPALQDPTWDWVPYLAAGIVGMVLVAGFMWKLMKYLNSTSTSSTTSTGGSR